MLPYFSIIVPVYNVENYLDRCLRSILEQDFSDYEVILVDDGSTDQSGSICDRYADKYEQVHVIHKENGGLGSARNAGMAQATGTYMLFIDSDDWIDGNTLSTIKQAIGNTRVDMVKYNYVRHENGEHTCLCNVSPGLYATPQAVEQLIDRAFYSTGVYGLSSCMHAYNREFLAGTGVSFYSEREVGSEDFLFNLELLLQAQSVLVMENAFYHYDMRVGSLTQRYRENLPEKYTKLYTILSDKLKQQEKTDLHKEKLCYFYVWELLCGTCLPNEYTVFENHSRQEGRRRVREMLRFPELQEAIRLCDKSRMTWSQLVKLCALKYRVEILFYWLFLKMTNE